MKHTIFTLLFLCAGLLRAQEFSYTITSELGDSTFTLDVITTNSANRLDIKRTTGLDSSALQFLQYARIKRLREEQARLELEIEAKKREAVLLLQSLNDYSLNDYIATQRTEMDSTFVNETGWLLRSSDALNITLSTVYREGNTTILRDAPGSNYAVILPQSPNYIELLFLSDNSRVELFSNNGRVYRGESNGVRYLFRKNR